MNKIKLKLQSKEPLVIALVLFVCSFIIGIIFSKVGSKLLMDEFDTLNRGYFERLKNLDISYGSLLRYIIISHYKKFFIFWLLSITILAIPYMALSIIKKGFQLGFLFSALTMQYNFKGFLLMLVYIFPQGLIYVPIIYYSLKTAYQISIAIKNSNDNSLHNIFMLRKYKKMFIILLSGIFLGALIETFIGSFLIKKILLLF